MKLCRLWTPVIRSVVARWCSSAVRAESSANIRESRQQRPGHRRHAGRQHQNDQQFAAPGFKHTSLAAETTVSNGKSFITE